MARKLRGRMPIHLLAANPVVTDEGEDTPWYLAGGVDPENVKGAWQAVAAGSLAASYINLATPGTNDLTTATAPTWASESGWTFNGSTQYLDTGIAPASNQTWSFVIQYQGAASGNYTACGSIETMDASEFAVYPSLAAGVVRYEYGATTIGRLDVTGTHPTGNLIIAGRNAYRDGVSDGTIPLSTPAQTWPSMYIGGSNLEGIGLALTGAIKVQLFALYNTIITPEQAALIYATIRSRGFFLAP